MVQTNLNIPPANTPLIRPNGSMEPAWYRYFVGLQTTANGAAAGEVATPPGGGLEGGGAVSDGISLSIAPDGVTDAMLRESLGCSVIGRFVNSTGNPADIQATADDRVLGRFSGQLAFKDISLLPGVGTVTTVSVVTANGVSGSVANPTTTPAITLTLGNITPTSVDTGASRCDSFRIDQTPTAEVVVCTHTITISVDGTNYKIPIVAA